MPVNSGPPQLIDTTVAPRTDGRIDRTEQVASAAGIGDRKNYRCSRSDRVRPFNIERGLQSPTAINPSVIAEHLHCRRCNPKLAAERVQIALNRLIPVRIDNRDLLVRSGRGQLVKTIGMTNL